MSAIESSTGWWVKMEVVESMCYRIDFDWRIRDITSCTCTFAKLQGWPYMRDKKRMSEGHMSGERNMGWNLVECWILNVMWELGRCNLKGRRGDLSHYNWDSRWYSGQVLCGKANYFHNRYCNWRVLALCGSSHLIVYSSIDLVLY